MLRAAPRAQAAAIVFHARDGYTESLPLQDVLVDPGILVAHGLDGAPLTSAHGYPARILIPGRYGMKGPKWLDVIELQPDNLASIYESIQIVAEKIGNAARGQSE